MSPAPWTFRGNGLRDANDRVILLTVPAVGLPIAEDMANRAAIESAPELVAALRAVVAIADRETPPFIRARELLAKLEGGT